MFTGIIQAMGTVANTCDTKRGRFITIKTDPNIVRAVPAGGSVSVDGVCLTSLFSCHPERSEGSRAHARNRTFVRDSSPALPDQNDKSLLTFELLDSTLKCTTLDMRKVGDRVNVEPALRAADMMGGHFVSGHVDGVGRVREVRERGHTRYVTITVPKVLARYLVTQGSVVVNGVSLTIVEVMPSYKRLQEVTRGYTFSVALTSYTLTHTNLGALKAGGSVNVEVDMLAKYLFRFSTLSSRGRRPRRSPRLPRSLSARSQ